MNIFGANSLRTLLRHLLLTSALLAMSSSAWAAIITQSATQRAAFETTVKDLSAPQTPSTDAMVAAMVAARDAGLGNDLKKYQRALGVVKSTEAAMSVEGRALFARSMAPPPPSLDPVVSADCLFGSCIKHCVDGQIGSAYCLLGWPFCECEWPVPSLWPWGMLILVVFLLGAGAFAVTRRRTQVA
jgi:hypothetical protein